MLKAVTHVVATLGSAGDLHPFLAIARALQEQGAEVLFLSQEPFRAEVEAQGVSFYPIVSAHDHYRTAAHPALWHPIRGFGVLWRHMAVPAIGPTLQVIQKLLAQPKRQHRLKILASPLVVGAKLAHERWPAEIDFSTGHTAPSGLRSSQDPMFFGHRKVPSWIPQFAKKSIWYWLDKYKLQPMAMPTIERWRTELKLPSLTEPIFEKWFHSHQRVFGFFPENFGPMPTDWPVNVNLTGFLLYENSRESQYDPELFSFYQKANKKLTVIYPGSAPTRQRERLWQLGQSLSQKNKYCLFLGDPVEISARENPYLLQRKRVQLPDVLAHAQLFAHHGGIGACAQGLAANVRQWVFPSAYDQHDNAWRLAQLGYVQPHDALNQQALATAALAILNQNTYSGASTQRSVLVHSFPNAPNSGVKKVITMLGI